MKTKREHKREFWCETCQPIFDKSMTPAQFKEHLRTVHGLEGKISGRAKGMSFLDGADGYDNTYAWTLPGGVKVTELRSGPKEQGF